MNKLLPLLCALLLGAVASAQSSSEKVEALKQAIPSPKYEVGDTLYISFVNDPAADTRYLRPSDLSTLRVVLIDCRLANYDGGLYLSLPVADFPLSWEYQFVDAALPRPKYSDRSEFYQENRFGATSAEAQKSLLENE